MDVNFQRPLLYDKRIHKITSSLPTVPRPLSPPLPTQQARALTSAGRPPASSTTVSPPPAPSSSALGIGMAGGQSKPYARMSTGGKRPTPPTAAELEARAQKEREERIESRRKGRRKIDKPMGDRNLPEDKERDRYWPFCMRCGERKRRRCFSLSQQDSWRKYIAAHDRDPSTHIPYSMTCLDHVPMESGVRCSVCEEFKTRAAFDGMSRKLKRLAREGEIIVTCHDCKQKLKRLAPEDVWRSTL